MAATQSENQQNDVSNKRDEQDNINAASLLPNGTDKNALHAGASVVQLKNKSGCKDLPIEMSQYKADSNSSASTTPSNVNIIPSQAASQCLSTGSEANLTENECVPTSTLPSGSASGGTSPFSADGSGDGYGFPYSREPHAGPEGMHVFGPRHVFTGVKQQPSGPPSLFSPQTRFVGGQGFPQQQGHTPTLNQLLQSSNSMSHRYQNNYDQAYNQSWSQKSLPHFPGAPPSASPGAGSAPHRMQVTLPSSYGSCYGESGRTAWSVHPHTSSSIAPVTSSVTQVSQSSPQPASQPSQSPGSNAGLPPSPQHQGFPNRPAQPTTPNTLGPDAAELSGGNSNDSSSGPAPGTPNSQGMRPTPSPTGSTGSRSMSPAVGQQNIPTPPRPSSGPSESSVPGRISHSPIGNNVSPANYSGHAHPGYKTHPGMSPSAPPSPQQLPMYQSGQQYVQASSYTPRPQYSQGYGPSSTSIPPPITSQATPTTQNSISTPPVQQQYTGRQAVNHMSNSQFPSYQQSPGWSPTSKAPVQPTTSQPSTSVSPRPPHYLKHHLQHKMGFPTPVSGTPPSPGSPQNYHMGPPPIGHHHGMGPPTNPPMGPPNTPHSQSLISNSHDTHMPPPSSTPNSHTMASDIMDNGITTSAQLGSSITVTSIVTTGPDGAPIDEGSQQSTLSNASAASGGEDQQCTTPKSARKNDMGHYVHQSGPPGNVPSPANSMHEEYGEMNSSNWPRTPASPVFNAHVAAPDAYRSKKTDSLSKLYEMDDSPERRMWLDKLLLFMDERRTPITTCPTISKNPLDLFRLYLFVKDRGGFMEVTKNKTWKDIAGLLGIGASSSAAYTLRKHYTKNLLAYECQFDRGGIDPQPIINQVEASSKKKGTKAVSVPSPGSSNSQDSFPPSSSGGSVEGYNYNFGSGSNQDYGQAMQRPSSQSNSSSPHSGATTNHLNSVTSGGPSPTSGGGGDNVNISNPFEDISPSPQRGGSFAANHSNYQQSGTPPRQQPQNYPAGVQGNYGQYPNPSVGGAAPPDQYSYPSNANYPAGVRPVYPSYLGDGGAPPATGGTQSPANTQDHFNRYNINNSTSGGYQPRPAYGGASGQLPPNNQPSGTYSQPDYYRSPDQSQKNMPPPGPQPPRRHPDFAKDQQPYQYGQARPQVYNWPSNNQFRPTQYSNTTGPQMPPTQQWQGNRPPGGQWERYPPGSQPPYNQGPPNQQQWNSMTSQGLNQSSNLRTTVGSRMNKPFSSPILPSKGSQNTPSINTAYSSNQQMQKREITFPPDSVESVLPVVYRRKRLMRTDVGPVDAWRIMMCLRSGLLAESTYALDMLNILLYDDTSVLYFGLHQWPNLLDLLLEHFQKCLSDMFDGPFPKVEVDEKAVDLGGIDNGIDMDQKTLILKQTNNYSVVSRKGEHIKIIEKNEDIFVRDHKKDWDMFGEIMDDGVLQAIETDPWSVRAPHLLPVFHADFGYLPFHMHLDNNNDENQLNSNTEKENLSENVAAQNSLDSTKLSSSSILKPSEHKHRTKTLNDVISRIKRENEDIGDKENANKNIKCEAVNDCGKLRTGVNGDIKCEKAVSTLVKKRKLSDDEDEAYTRDESSLVLVTESQDNLGKRCVCVSNILRNLSFVPGNDLEFSKNPAFLKLVGKLLLLHHTHPPRAQKTRNYDREEDADFADSCSSLQGEGEWWWDFLIQIRENILVSIANMAGQIDVSQFCEEIARPLLDGLLHWAICPSAAGQDPFPTSSLSPQRLALEALCKLCVTHGNVDLVIATPPFSRLEKLCNVLTKHLCRSEDQVLREFSINLLHYLAAADSSLARVVAVQTPCISLLVAFIEHAEQSALGVANQHGIGALRDNPDSMGTSLDMLRRAAATLVFLAQHPDNRTLLVQQESRLLALVMSQILDQQVALLLSKVLFQISRS